MAANAESELYWASKQGDRNNVNKLLKERINPLSKGATGGHGDTPLHWACRYGWLDVVKSILEQDEDQETSLQLVLSPFQAVSNVMAWYFGTSIVEVKDGAKQTPVYYACRGGHLNVVRYLCEQCSCDLNLKDKNKCMPVDYALQFGHTEVVKYLIDERNCKPEGELRIIHDSEWTWLKFACQFGYLEIVKTLKLGSGVHSELERTPLHYACESGCLDIAEYLVGLNYDCDAQDEKKMTPLHYACKNGHLKMVQYLGELQCDLNAVSDEQQTPLHIASISGHVSIVRYLTNKGCDFETKDEDDQSPLDYALQLKHFEIVKIFISEQQFEPTTEDIENNRIWLTFACQCGYLGMVKSFFDQNHIQDIQMLTLMHDACQGGHLDIVKYLHQLNFDHNSKDVHHLTPLHHACQAGHLHIVQYLEQLGCNQNARDEEQRTPLHHACLNGHVSVVKHLCKYSPISIRNDLWVKDEHELYPLDCAWQNGHHEVVNYLITHQHCKPNEQFKDVCSSGWTWLTYASRYGHLTIVQYLIDELGCDPDSRDGKQRTPLHYACCGGHLEIVKYLDARQCTLDIKDKEQRIPLDYAYIDGHNHVVEYLRDSLDEDQLPPVHYACQHGNIKAVKSFPRESLELKDSNCRTPLHIACANGHLTIVRYLLEGQHCDQEVKDKDQQTPLHYASKYGHIDIVQYLIHRQPHINGDSIKDVHGMTPLHYASKSGHVNIVQCFYSHSSKCDLEVRDEHQRAPLHYASQYGHTKVVQYLSSKHDPNVVDEDLKTPLHYACDHEEVNNLIVVKYLISERGCQPEVKDKHKMTPLHYASQRGQIKIVRYLIDEQHCCKKVEDVTKYTPLHFACMNGHSNVVKYLIREKGFNPDVKARYQVTPLHLASKYGHTNVVRYLIDKRQCNPLVRDADQLSPLHYACRGGHLDTVQYLINNNKSKSHVEDVNRRTPLHFACQKGHKEVAEYLVCVGGAYSEARDRDLRTPLHYTCQHGHIDVVQYLVQRCSAEAIDKAHMTPLHYACYTTNQNLEVVKFLVKEIKCDPSKAARDGNNALHFSVMAGKPRMPTVSYLLSEAMCDPDVKNQANHTPVQLITIHNIGLVKEFMNKTRDHVTLFRQITLLLTLEENRNEMLMSLMSDISEQKTYDLTGDTALHVACKADSPLIVQCLLHCKRFDPTFLNSEGKAPVEVIPNNNRIIIKQLLQCGTNLPTSDVCKIHKEILDEEKPPQPFVKVFVIGDGSSGKSTLVAALKQVSWLTSSKLYLFSRRVSDVPMATTGIIPFEFDSPFCGNIALHDFAGRREFHGSQATVLQNAIHFSPPVILLVVDLSKSGTHIKQSIEYWMSFVDDQSTSVSQKPRIIIVGSHTDKINSKERKGKIRFVKGVVKKSTEYSGLVDLNCRYPDSKRMTDLRALLAKDCKDLRPQDPIKFNAHCFLKYLENNFNGKCGVQLKTVLMSMTEKPKPITGYIPSDKHMLACICHTLHNRGHILFLQDQKMKANQSCNTADLENSWIITGVETLLEKVTGTVFAPEKFQQQCQLASSTGIVPMSNIKSEVYPQDDDISNTEMLVEFMSHLEICHEICDVEVLPQIGSQDAPGERYFLFPSLIAQEIPNRVWKSQKDFKYHCGWILRCTHVDHFFTSQIFTALMPKLIFSTSRTNAPRADLEGFPALQQTCSVWKNGIFWSNDNGGEVMLEIIENCKTILIQFRHRNLTTDCLQLRSNIIQKVLPVVNDLSSRITIKEYFIDPSEICDRHSGQGIYSTSIDCGTLAEFESCFNVYSLKSIGASIMRSKDDEDVYVTSKRGTQIPLESLLCFEPYAVISSHGRSVLLNPKCSQYVIEIEPESLISRRSTRFPLIKLLDESGTLNFGCTDVEVVNALKTWSSSCGGTYRDLHEKLEQFSVFAERNDVISGEGR